MYKYLSFFAVCQSTNVVPIFEYDSKQHENDEHQQHKKNIIDTAKRKELHKRSLVSQALRSIF